MIELTSCALKRVGCIAGVVLSLHMGILPACSAAANPRPAVEAVLKLAAIVSAGKASEEATTGIQEYFADATPPGHSIYAVEFDFERASWADWFSKPDIFLALECEGGQRLVIPDIEYGWDYSAKIFTFRCPTLPAGSRCVLRLYDDDSTSDQVWTNVLATRVTWNAAATARPGDLFPARGLVAMQAQATAEGEIQLLTLDQAKRLVLDAPDPMATAQFVVPRTLPFARWEMEGDFIQDATTFGKVRLTHWHTNPLPAATSYLLRPRLAFWVVIAVGCVGLLVLGWIRRARHTDSPTEPPMKGTFEF